MSSPATSVTPAMRQYLEAKRQHRDAIVFFRMADFYEMFYEDALAAARALDLPLTSRSKDAAGAGIPMCGVPFHAVDGYLAKLVGKGFRVAICEQVEDPRKAKGVVKREVVRVVSPGTLTDASYLDAREPAYVMAIVGRATAPHRASVRGGDPAEGSPGGPDRVRPTSTTSEHEFGVALIDLSTGEFTTAEYRGTEGLAALGDDISVLRPREIVIPAESAVADTVANIRRLQIPVTSAEPWGFEAETARHTLLDQLKAHGLEGFGLDGRTAAVQAAGGLLAHLRATQKTDLAHVRTVSFKTVADCLIIDPITLKHLEIVTGSEGGTK